MHYDLTGGRAGRSRIPVHAGLLSLACLAVPLVGTVLWRDGLGTYGLLLWVSALVPPFLLAMYRGWSGAAMALAAGMAALSMAHAGLVWTNAGPVSWQIPTVIGVTLILVSLGSGWLSERLWRQVALAERNAAELSLVLEPEGRIVMASASAQTFLGVPAAELEGARIAALVHEDDAAVLSRVLDGPADSDGVNAEVRFRHADRGYRSFELVIGALNHRRGRGLRVLVARDVTARRAADEQLRRTQTMRVAGRMVAVLAHETNNLLTSLNGHIDALEQHAGPADLRRYQHPALQRSSQRVGSLIRQLVGFTQQSDLRLEPVFLNSFIQQRMHFFQKLLPVGVHLNVAFEDDGGFVAVDGGGLAEAMTSIIANAAAATKDGDEVTVRIRRDTIDAARSGLYGYAVKPGPYIVTEIEDTGHGMPAEVLRRALDPFFTTCDTPGTLGLGLSAAYGFVKQSGGYLWIRSEPGAGTTVSIYLPEQPAPTETEAPEPDSYNGDGQPRFRTVLIVEDEPLVLSFMRSVLLRHGYSVLEAADGLDAFEQFGQAPVDILVTDLRVPGLRGDELLRRLRVINPELPAVITSGFADRNALDPQLFEAPTEVLDKPFSPPELLSAIARAEEADTALAAR
jgi:PAS domain S-box-containing protein